MKVKAFDIEFSHANRVFNASCQKFKVPWFHNYPMIRVAVDRRKGKTDIYIFYEINSDKQKYFWYDLPDMQQLIAKSIEKALLRHTDKPELN